MDANIINKNTKDSRRRYTLHRVMTLHHVVYRHNLTLCSVQTDIRIDFLLFKKNELISWRVKKKMYSRRTANSVHRDTSLLQTASSFLLILFLIRKYYCVVYFQLRSQIIK